MWRCVSEKQAERPPPPLWGTTTPHREHCSMFIEKDMEKRRTRNYATVVYPDSAPADWIMLLQEQCVPALISPLHNRDVNNDGTLKKEHYHVLLLFSGVKTREQAQEVFSVIGGVGIEPVKCARAYARYLCHLDNPQKAQYDIEDVISCSGADYYTMINLATDKYSAIGEMIEFCIQNNIVSYARLLLFAKENRQDWFRVLCDNGTLTMVQFLKSHYWEISKYEK